MELTRPKDKIFNSMNLQEDIQRIKQVMNLISEEKVPATPNELIKSLPKDLKILLFKQWGAKQNPKWHPEGNSLKHIIVVIKRAYNHYGDDPNMIMAALFHDLGKMDTYAISPKTGEPTAYGHENKSTDYVEQFKDWILTFEGTDIDEIKYLVQNHMKVKPSTWDSMRDSKKEPISSHPSFDKLKGFTDKLDGGGYEIDKGVNEAYTPWVKRRLAMVRKAERASYYYMVNTFKRRMESDKEFSKNDFINMYFSIMMDEMHGALSSWGTEDFDYPKVYKEITDSFGENAEELWKHLKK